MSACRKRLFRTESDALAEAARRNHARIIWTYRCTFHRGWHYTDRLGTGRSPRGSVKRGRR